MPKLFSFILDRIFPCRVRFRKEEQERAVARRARKESLEEEKKWKYEIIELLLDDQDETPPIDKEEQIKQIVLENNWAKKAVRKYFSPKNLKNVEGQLRMYEVEIVSPHFHKTNDSTYVYAYVECRDCKHGATVFIAVPEMFGKEESFKALAFYDDEETELTDSKTIEMAWRIFSPLFDDMAA